MLAEKVASAKALTPDLLQRSALADFAAFGLFKRAGLEPEALSALQKGLGFGVGVGLPALGVGHMLLRDANHQGRDLVHDARNQALLTAAGVGGMQGLGALLQARMNRPPVPQPPSDLGTQERLAAAVLVDDVLEAACNEVADNHKTAALIELVNHRRDSMKLVRDWLSE